MLGTLACAGARRHRRTGGRGRRSIGQGRRAGRRSGRWFSQGGTGSRSRRGVSRSGAVIGDHIYFYSGDDTSVVSGSGTRRHIRCWPHDLHGVAQMGLPVNRATDDSEGLSRTVLRYGVFTIRAAEASLLIDAGLLGLLLGAGVCPNLNEPVQPSKNTFYNGILLLGSLPCSGLEFRLGFDSASDPYADSRTSGPGNSGASEGTAQTLWGMEFGCLFKKAHIRFGEPILLPRCRRGSGRPRFQVRAMPSSVLKSNFGVWSFTICRVPGPSCARGRSPASLPIVEPASRNGADRERVQ